MTVNLAAGASTTVGPFDTGTSCTVSEPVLPTAPTGWTFGAPVIATSPATIVKGDSAAAVVSDRHQLDHPRPGLPENQQGLRSPDLRFHRHICDHLQLWRCRDQTVNLAAGARLPLDLSTPERAALSLSRHFQPPHRLDFRYGHDRDQPGHHRQGRPSRGCLVTVTNSITRDQGYLKISKVFDPLTSGFSRHISSSSTTAVCGIRPSTWLQVHRHDRRPLRHRHELHRQRAGAANRPNRMDLRDAQ